MSKASMREETDVIAGECSTGSFQRSLAEVNSGNFCEVSNVIQQEGNKASATCGYIQDPPSADCAYASSIGSTKPSRPSIKLVQSQSHNLLIAIIELLTLMGKCS